MWVGGVGWAEEPGLPFTQQCGTEKPQWKKNGSRSQSTQTALCSDVAVLPPGAVCLATHRAQSVRIIIGPEFRLPCASPGHDGQQACSTAASLRNSGGTAQHGTGKKSAGEQHPSPLPEGECCLRAAGEGELAVGELAPHSVPSVLGAGSRSTGHNGEAQCSKRTKMLRQPLPIQTARVTRGTISPLLR